MLFVCGYYLTARDNDERAKWVHSLEETTHYSSSGRPSPRQTPPTHPSPVHVVDVATLTRKLQEAEAYEQMLSNQSQVKRED